MPNINITVAAKIATNTTPGEVIVCGNSDYTVTFAFDSEWDAQTERTARFVYYRDGLSLYKDVAFTGNTVAVPVLSNISYVLVGVYAGELRTTTPAKVLCDRSILCGDPLEVLTPEEKAKLQAQIGDLSQLETSDKSSLVAAINEAAKTGGTTGSDSSQNGNDGFSPIATVVQTAAGAVISITDKDGTTTATITNGKDGADGAPGEKGDKGDKGDPGEPGEQGEDGSDYVLTDEDKTEIAEMAAELVEAPAGTGFVESPTAPEDTSVLWLDTSDNSGDTTEMKPLTFTGAVEATYDGTEAMSVEIPSGGSGGAGRLIADITTTEEVYTITQEFDVAGNADVTFYYYVPPSSTASTGSFKIGNQTVFSSGCNYTSNTSNYGAGIITWFKRNCDINGVRYTCRGAGLNNPNVITWVWQTIESVTMEIYDTPFPIGTRLIVVAVDYDEV